MSRNRNSGGDDIRSEEFGELKSLGNARRSPSEVGFNIDPEYARMSPREQKRYVKKVRQDLDRELAEVKSSMKDVKAEQKELARKRAASAADIERTLRERASASKKRDKQNKVKRSRANNTADALGYNLMYANGICEVEEGFFSETLEFDDITYQSARDDDQKNILATLCDVYNYFSSDTVVQFSVINTPLREQEVRTRQFYDADAQANDVLREDAEVMNEVLTEKMAQGVSNIRRRRFITVGVHANDPEDAYRRLSRINTDIAGNFEQIRCKLKPLDGCERLNVMSSLLRPSRPFSFSYDDLSCYACDSTKDAIAPMSMDFKPDGASTYFKMDDMYCQALVMRKYDSPLEDKVVAKLVDMPMPIEVTWHLKPYDKAEAINFVKSKRTFISAEVISEQKKAVRQGYDYSILPSELSYSQDEADDLLAMLQGQQQNLFDFSGLIYTWAETPEELTEQVLQIIDVAGASGVHVELLDYRQRQALPSVLPLASNHIEISRPMTTAEACIFVPFATQELDQEGGSWYYQNRLSNNLVFGNRANLASPVGFIAGKTGSGKGFFAKNEIEGTLLSKPNDQVIIFDRAGEYRLLVEHAQGTYATFGVGFDAHLNPLGMGGLEGRDFGTQVAFKADAMIAQAAAASSESGAMFSEEEQSIIQRCVENIYRRWRDGGMGGREPILSDYYEELRRQPEPVAQDIALRYERYVQGYSAFFNHPTDIDLDARVVGLNFKEVPDSMLVFALISFCETVRFIMYRNFEQGRRTWLYIEEMESLFKYPSVLNYFRRFSNECRKFGMYLTGITQSTESMIRNQDANAIVKNSDFIMLLKQSKEDRDYWANARGLSRAECGYIDDSAKRGWGLLLFGDARIPIKGDFPKDNHLYELFSTDPNEWEEKKARGDASAKETSGGEFRRRRRSRGRKKKADNGAE
ncbi:MAG: DUF87 domain-containing protein [Coriobacteriaceae bacterium]|nr:DUF87 domain-containing protein [Coriobacteriaceae bacterium]